MTKSGFLVSLKPSTHGISKEDFAVISNLQRLDRINALEKSEPIRLSLQNQILTSEDENSTNSDRSDSDNPPALKGDKVTRKFLPHHVFLPRLDYARTYKIH